MIVCKDNQFFNLNNNKLKININELEINKLENIDELNK